MSEANQRVRMDAMKVGDIIRPRAGLEIERVPDGWIYWRWANVDGTDYHDSAVAGALVIPITGVFVPRVA